MRRSSTRVRGSSGYLFSGNKILTGIGRERKRNEALAASIFSKERRLSAPSKTPSLASRVGVKKVRPPALPFLAVLRLGRVLTGDIKQRVASTSSKPPAGDINGEWTHDLHASVSAPSLASRITAPGAKPRAAKRAAKLAHALQRADPTSVAPTGPKFNPPTGPKAQAKKPQRNGTQEQEISIRGLAGPFSVLMQNFAPGTTAADIESVMTPVGGEMLVCRIVKTRPIMLAEMVFGSREAGDRVIEAFDGKTVRLFLPPFPPLLAPS